jgi:hypothetical protein
MRASAYLDKHADSRAVEDQAANILAKIQNEFRCWGNTVYATRDVLT